MNKIIAFLMATILMLSLSVGALADGPTWSMPYVGTCGGSTDCFAVQNSANNGMAAVSGYSSGTGNGVWGTSGSSSNVGAGVIGQTGNSSLGVGVKGIAPAGSTPIWAHNESGAENTGIWSDARIYVANTDFWAYTSGKGIVMRNGSVCARVKLNATGNGLLFDSVTCP